MQGQNGSLFNSIWCGEVTLLVCLAGPWVCNLNVLAVTGGREKTVLGGSWLKKDLHCPS